MNKPESSEMVLVPREPTPEMISRGGWCANMNHQKAPTPLALLIYRAMIAASPQAVPSEQPIAEQPNSEQPDSVYLGSAGPSEDLQTALPEAHDIEAVIACLGDDAAQLRDENPEDERAANMDDAAALLQKLAQQNAAVAKLLLAQDREGAKAWARGLHISMDHEGGLTAYVSEARVEPVVGPLSGARSDRTSMPPPAASLPVSAPAGVRMLTQEELYAALPTPRELGEYVGCHNVAFTWDAWTSYLRAIQRRFAEVNGLKLAAMSATTKEN